MRATLYIAVLVLLVGLAYTQPLPYKFSDHLTYTKTDLDNHCEHTGRRSGCSGCEADPNCSWCSRVSSPYYGHCTVSDDVSHAGTTCKEMNALAEAGFDEPWDIQEMPQLCKKKGAQPFPLSAEMVEMPGFPERLQHTASFSPKYCNVPDGHTVDYFAHYYLDSRHMCGKVNTMFGTRIYYGDIDTPADLLKAVFNNCGVCTHGGEVNPYKTAAGRECIKLMQNAFCSVSCNGFDEPRSRMCRDSPELAALYAACADYTDGPNQPARYNCPLDPNGLPLEFDDMIDCDDDWETFQRTGEFETDFMLNPSAPIPDNHNTCPP